MQAKPVNCIYRVSMKSLPLFAQNSHQDPSTLKMGRGGGMPQTDVHLKHNISWRKTLKAQIGSTISVLSKFTFNHVKRVCAARSECQAHSGSDITLRCRTNLQNIIISTGRKMGISTYGWGQTGLCGLYSRGQRLG